MEHALKNTGFALVMLLLLSSVLSAEVVDLHTASPDVICIVVELGYYDNNNQYPINNPLDLSSDAWLVDGKPVDATYRFSAPYDQLKNDEEGYSGAAILMHHRVYLKLAEPLENNKTYTVTTPFGEEELTFNDQETLCESIKVNQVGYCSGTTKRFANLGIFLGDGGPVKLVELPEYTVRNKNNGTVVHTGTVEFFADDTGLQTSASGEHVYRIDLSPVPDGGPYIISVQGFGRSYPFGVGTAYTKEIARTLARGMYHQRCGIALEEPYTRYTRPACHNDVCYTSRVEWGNGTWIDVPEGAEMGNIFGGYHDAADFDRRPFHTIISVLMLSYFEAFKDHFIDDQYTIPESGNGIPDFLDEALWGLKLWEHLQMDDGDVMAGTETSRHPAYGQVNAATDQLVYGTYDVMEKTTIECTGMFAHAARLVRPYDSARADSLLERAERGWTKIVEDGMTDNRSVLMYAALQLYLATATGTADTDMQNKYHSKFREYATAIFPNGSWPDQYLPGNTSANVKTGHFISYIITSFPTDSDLVSTMRAAIFNGADNGGYMGWKLDTYPYPMGVTKFMGWGAATAQGRFADVYCFAWLLTDDTQKKQNYYNAIGALSDYSLGLNPLGQSYVTGLGTVQPVSPLHADSYYTKYGKGDHDGDPIGNVPGIVVYGPTEGRSGAEYQLNISDKIYPVWDSIAPQRRWSDGWALVNGNEFTTWETIVWNNCMFGFLYNAGESGNEGVIHHSAAHRINKRNSIITSYQNKDWLHLNVVHGNSMPVTVTLLDLKGRILKSLYTAESEIIMNISHMAAGTFLLKVQQPEQTNLVRVVISR